MDVLNRFNNWFYVILSLDNINCRFKNGSKVQNYMISIIILFYPKKVVKTLF